MKSVFCLAAYYSQDWFEIFEKQVLWRTCCEGRISRSYNLPTKRNIWTRGSLSSVNGFDIAECACSLSEPEPSKNCTKTIFICGFCFWHKQDGTSVYYRISL
jgi:hypothetical protein